ncbi:MAG TPA: sugar-transfer associated ATP-grasp domain-containing protein [Gemmatimonadales bacterium]|nr:sugar-transfer associated ATP-grasp domain-containing protein [Gemmatimonadales bacterium]
MKLAYRLEQLRHGSTYGTAEAAYNWLRHEVRTRARVPLSRRLGLWRRGFFSDSDLIYGFANEDHGTYLSDYQHLRVNSSIQWNWLYKHKLAFRGHLLALGVRQADTLACVYHDRVLLQPFSGSPVSGGPEELAALLMGADAEYIVKPEDSGGGRDIFLLESRGGELVRRRGQSVQPFDPVRFAKLLRADPLPRATLIERRVHQAPFWNTLFPGSANTIRVLTLWTPGEVEPFVANAVQRMGTADTAPTDNWSGGGISAPVALDTGTLGAGRMHPLKGKRPRHRFTHHPDTGARIEGARLPGWDTITATVLRVARTLPFNPATGWDVLVDFDGEPMVLEANANSDIDLHQVHGGLLASPRVRRFYERIGVL